MLAYCWACIGYTINKFLLIVWHELEEGNSIESCVWKSLGWCLAHSRCSIKVYWPRINSSMADLLLMAFDHGCVTSKDLPFHLSSLKWVSPWAQQRSYTGHWRKKGNKKGLTQGLYLLVINLSYMLPENPDHPQLATIHQGTLPHLSSPENETWAWLTWAWQSWSSRFGWPKSFRVRVIIPAK